jgi:hypothetical protein
MITDPDGHEQTVLVKNDDLHLDEHGQLVLSNITNPQDEIRNILSKLSEDISKSLDDSYSVGDDGSAMQNNVDGSATQITAGDDGSATQNNEEQKRSLSDEQSQLMVDPRTSVKEEIVTVLSELSPGMEVSEITVTDEMISTHLQEQNILPILKNQTNTQLAKIISNPESGVCVRDVPDGEESGLMVPDIVDIDDSVLVKRKRGRPKGSFRGRKPIQKGTCDICGKTLNNASNLSGENISNTPRIYIHIYKTLCCRSYCLPNSSWIIV